MTGGVLHARRRGYGLVEIMVALTLGLLVVGAAFVCYGEGRTLHVRSAELARLNERAAYAVSVLEPDLQLAGYFGFASDAAQLQLATADGRALAASSLQAASPPAPGLPRGAQACGNNFALDVSHPVAVGDGGFRLSCAASGGGAVPGADTLTIRRASASSADPADGRVQLITHRLVPANQLLFVGPRLPPGDTLLADRVELRQLLVHTYYVARLADGDPRAAVGGAVPALRVKSLTAVAGAPAFVDTEVVPGVEDLQVELGYVGADPAAPSTTTRFASAAALPADATVVAARVWLRLRAEKPEPGFLDLQAYEYAGQRFVPRDHYRRLLIEHTVALRNRTSPART